MSTGTIITRKLRSGKPAYLLKYDAGPDPDTGERRQCYKQLSGPEWNKRKAGEELRRLLTEVDTGDYVNPSAETVADYLRRWLKDFAPMECESGATLERYGQIIEGNVIPSIGTIRLQKLTPTKVQALYTHLMTSGRINGEGGLSKRTVHHIHRLLNNAFSTAVDQGYVNRNPCAKARPPKVPKVDRKKIAFLTDEETAVMLKVLSRAKSDNLRTLIVLAVTSGMRRGEMLGLHWSGVDLPVEADGTTGTIKVEWSLEETKDGLRLKEPKTESSLRTIEIPPMTVQALRQHRAWQAEYRMKLGRPDNDWLVFETPHVKEDGSVEFCPWRPRNVTKAFGLFIKRTPVTKITLHGLRHTHITSALMAGENIKVVSERAGHSGVQITLDTYGHVIPGKDRDIAVSHEQRLMAYMGKN